MNIEILTIIDKSGSMDSIRADSIGGFNGFLKNQQEDKENSIRHTLALFSSGQHLPFGQAPQPIVAGSPFGQVATVMVGGYDLVGPAGQGIHQVKPLNLISYVPSGGTALNDAIGKTLDEQGARIKREGWANRVIVCILTDGGENSSRVYSAARVKEMITQAQAMDWVFVYLAANVDAFETGNAMGIARNYQGHATTMTFNANAAGTATAYGSMMDSVNFAKAAPLPVKDAPVETKTGN